MARARGTGAATFQLDDELRPGARELVARLKREGKSVSLLTGDHEQAARRIAGEAGIEQVGWGLRPEDKLARLQALQAQGAIVAMIGDGANDAPVLARAQVSIAMGGGTAVALANADLILLSDRLENLNLSLDVARKTLTVIRENIGWAIAYNLIALPAAAVGWVPPWAAAIGMSASSLLVVGNALRLTRTGRSAEV